MQRESPCLGAASPAQGNRTRGRGAAALLPRALAACSLLWPQGGRLGQEKAAAAHGKTFPTQLGALCLQPIISKRGWEPRPC